MKVIKTYSRRLDADMARITLAAADLPSEVVGVGSELEGGSSGVQLLVSEEDFAAALAVLDRA